METINLYLNNVEKAINLKLDCVIVTDLLARTPSTPEEFEEIHEMILEGKIVLSQEQSLNTIRLKSVDAYEYCRINRDLRKYNENYSTTVEISLDVLRNIMNLKAQEFYKGFIPFLLKKSSILKFEGYEPNCLVVSLKEDSNEDLIDSTKSLIMTNDIWKQLKDIKIKEDESVEKTTLTKVA